MKLEIGLDRETGMMMVGIGDLRHSTILRCDCDELDRISADFAKAARMGRALISMLGLDEEKPDDSKLD